MALLLVALFACSAGPSAPADVAGDYAGHEAFPGTEVFRPAGEPRGAIVLLHGSEGGTAPYTAALARRFADEGFVAASFCWFGCGDLPAAVHRVPLDRTLEFTTWFRSGPAEGQPVVLYGASRGAEHAVLLASLLQDTSAFDGVAVHAASDTVVAAYDPATGGAVTAAGGYDAAWTWRGDPVYGERAMPFGSGPRIELERFPGPVWLSHGEDDPLWPASRTRSLEAARAGLPTEAHYWAGEGHIVLAPANVEAFVDSLVAFVDRVGP